MNEGARELVAGWTAAVARPEVVSDLLAIYADATAEIEKRGPVCWASGRCCNFRETGHLLYVTGLEAAYTLSRCGSPGLTRLAAATVAGGCPFQVANLCGAHADKPLGCRLFFCDQTAQQWQNDLYERLLSALRSLHARHKIEYRYGEWRGMLGVVIEHAELAHWTPTDLGTHYGDDVAGAEGGTAAGTTKLTVEGW